MLATRLLHYCYVCVCRGYVFSLAPHALAARSPPKSKHGASIVNAARPSLRLARVLVDGCSRPARCRFARSIEALRRELLSRRRAELRAVSCSVRSSSYVCIDCNNAPRRIFAGTARPQHCSSLSHETRNRAQFISLASLVSLSCVMD